MSARKLLALLFALSIVMAAPTGATAQTGSPSRVVIIVLDQARPDTITRYDMDNVKRLQRDGVNFPNAVVGDMAAETVISHNVITSGLFPKHMGWTDEVYRDVDGLIAAAGGYHVTSSMSCREYDLLINDGHYPKLQDYLDFEFGETSVFATIAQKRSAACTAGHVSDGGTTTPDDTPGDAEDVIFQIRGSGGFNCDGHPEGGWRVPEDGNGGSAAPYFPELTTQCNRWSTWQGAGAYGTRSIPPAQIYPLDGNRFVPGFDPAHLGGDIWSADAAIRIIESPAPWHGMIVSLGGIDKLGHMWGPEDRKTGPDGSVQQMRHLPFIAKTADEQVGRIVDALEDENLLDDTLIVITADHAAQTGNPFHGDVDGFPGLTGPLCDPPSNGIRSDCNWYYGNEAPAGAENYTDPSADFSPLVNAVGSNLAFSYQDGHIALWLHGDSIEQKSAAADAVLDLPDTIAAYRINADHDNYMLHGTNRMTPTERAWFATHAEALVDTMAHPTGPEVVGLVGNDVTWGVKGDHGGHNKQIQKIPMVFYGPGISSADSSREFRHVDVLPTILETMGIAYDEDDFDGEAVDIAE